MQTSQSRINKNALIIGNSDGIGLAFTQKLLTAGWQVSGVSRSPSNLNHERYTHHTADVQSSSYVPLLETILMETNTIDVCLYCPGIGEMLDVQNMAQENEIFEVNLNGLVKTVSVVIPAMVTLGSGHFLGLSSLADNMLSPQAPSYHASKAGFSVYLESLALALKPTGVSVTNVRFGFVDTKMAKGDAKPFMMPPEQAAEHLMRCLERKPVRYSTPKIMIPLIKLRKWMLEIQTW